MVLTAHMYNLVDVFTRQRRGRKSVREGVRECGKLKHVDEKRDVLQKGFPMRTSWAAQKFRFFKSFITFAIGLLRFAELY